MAINYRYHLDVNTIQFWLDQCKTLKLSAERIGEATRWCLQDCTRFPTWAEFVQRIPPKQEPDETLGCAGAVDTLDKIPAAPGHPFPWWWKGVTKAIALKGQPRIDAYNALIAEAKGRGEPQYEWVESHLYYETDRQGRRISVRGVTNCGWGRWIMDDRGRLMSGHCYRPDRRVIVRGM